MTSSLKTIQETADLAGVTAETLRHYDRIGLLRPADRSATGYRLFGREQLLRLREILLWRRLGFPLADIRAILDEPSHDHAEALRRQRELAGSQLAELLEVVRGIDQAIASLGDGRSVGEDDRLADLAGHPVPVTCDHASSANGKEARRSRFSGPLPPHRRPGAPPRPRIVATDPIRVAENLIALGLMPVAAGTYEDRFDAQVRGVWPWPSSVEPAVRRRIADLGYYGSDPRRIEQAAPDLILELIDSERELTLGELAGDGLGRSALSSLAPTVFCELDPQAPSATPGFLHRLPQIAAAVGSPAAAARLLASWRARVQAVRLHIQGREVSALVLFHGSLLVPSARHPVQLFSSLGLRVTAVEGESDHWQTRIGVEQLAALSAPTLFVCTRGASRQQVRELLEDPRLSRVPSAVRGRVFHLGWELINSGWFSANCQLETIARAYGVTRLCTEDGRDRLHLAVDPVRGLVTLSAAGRCPERASLVGPDGSSFDISLEEGGEGCVRLSSSEGKRLACFPQDYELDLPAGARLAIVPDRESALARILEPQAEHAEGALAGAA